MKEESTRLWWQKKRNILLDICDTDIPERLINSNQFIEATITCVAMIFLKFSIATIVSLVR